LTFCIVILINQKINTNSVLLCMSKNRYRLIPSFLEVKVTSPELIMTLAVLCLKFRIKKDKNNSVPSRFLFISMISLKKYHKKTT
jgi:hypothetical protein